jgi:hypothetical protein
MYSPYENLKLSMRTKAEISKEMQEGAQNNPAMMKYDAA